MEITLTGINSVLLLGENDRHLKRLKKVFPDIKIISRGEKIQFFGRESQVLKAKKIFHQMATYIDRHKEMNELILGQLIENGGNDISKTKVHLVKGAQGQSISTKTMRQASMAESIAKKDMLFTIGPAGTGKTFVSVALAVQFFNDKKVKKIILTRPAVEAGEHLGFLPGDLKEKFDPYLQPLYDALQEMIPTDKLNKYFEKKVIQIAPLAFMRGRTLDNAFVILDEAQNTTASQMKMFLTRMGLYSKFVINGDIGQIDLPKKQKSGLLEALDIVKQIPDVAVVYLDEQDIMRHKLVREIIKKWSINTRRI